MVRRLVYIVLTVIALQLSWTAVSAYCMHEAGVAARHFGHHEHTDHSDELSAANDEDPAPGAQKFGAHAHCASCAHAVLAVDLYHAASHPLAISTAPVGILPHFSSITATPPERPQWRAAA